jgi:hypothetical protein
MLAGQPRPWQRDALVGAVPGHRRLDQAGVTDSLGKHVADPDLVADDGDHPVAGLELQADPGP